MNTENPKSGISRREAIKLIGLGSLAVTSQILKGEIESFNDYDPSNPEIDVQYYKSPQPGKFIVVLFTDIHCGDENSAVNAQSLEPAVHKVNQQLGLIGAYPANTLLAITGDMVSKEENPKFHIKLPDGGETNIKDVPIMLEIMNTLCADYKVGVLGNHDIKYSHRTKLIKHLLQFGYQLPDIDQSVLMDFPLPIWGLPDYTEFQDYYTISQIAEIVGKSKSFSSGSILLSHNASVVDLVGLGRLLEEVYFLCGHTHGGHTKHKFLYEYALSENYHSKYIGGIHKVGSNVLHLPNGLGQHPQIIGRQVPAQIHILVFEG